MKERSEENVSILLHFITHTSSLPLADNYVLYFHACFFKRANHSANTSFVPSSKSLRRIRMLLIKYSRNSFARYVDIIGLVSLLIYCFSTADGCCDRDSIQDSEMGMIIG